MLELRLPQWQWSSSPSPHRCASGDHVHGEVSPSALNSLCSFASYGHSFHRSKRNGASLDEKGCHATHLAHDNGRSRHTTAKISVKHVGSSLNPSPDFTGGDDSGNGLGSGGSGGDDSGHGHKFWSGDPFGNFDDGMALLGMYAFFLGIGKATSLDDFAAFDCSNLFGDEVHPMLLPPDPGHVSDELIDTSESEEGLLDGESQIEHDIQQRCQQRHHFEEISNISASMQGHGFQNFANQQPRARKQPEAVIGWFARANQVSSPDEAEKGEKQVISHNSPDKSDKGEKERHLEVAEVQSQHVSTPLNVVSQPGGTPPAAKQSDVDALKRLQREIFSELMKLRERLEKMEKVAQAIHQSGASRTHLKGEVKAGAAFLLVEESNSRHSRDSLEQAGLQTGLDVRFMFETPFRERDLLITECRAGQASSVGDSRGLGGPLTLTKVQYVTHLNEDVSLSFVPFGAQGKDVTEIINVLQDQGLTNFSSQGPSLFTHCRGSALGATMSGSKFAFSVGQYLSGWGNHMSAMGVPSEGDPLCLSSLGQVLFQPLEGLVLSLSGLRRYWPSPPLPSSTALHWSEMGPLIIPKFRSSKTLGSNTAHYNHSNDPLMHPNRPSSHSEVPTDLEYGANAYGGKGMRLLSVAVASSFDLGESTSIGGWAQLETEDWLQASHGKDNLQWALSVERASGSGVDWGICVGGYQRDMWSIPSGGHDDYSGYDGGVSYGSQLHVEAFVKLHCGRGFTLQPGMLYVSRSHLRTPAFVVRSTWSL